MTDPGGKPEVNGGAVAGGILLALVLIPFLVVAGPAGLVTGIVVVGVAGFLVTRTDPVARGFGVGVLIGGAIAALLVGTCFVLLAGSDS